MEQLFPLFFPVAVPSAANLRPLQMELAFCEGLLLLMMEHLRGRLTPAERDTPLGRMLSSDDPAAVERLVAEIDQSLSSKREDLALRTLRAETPLIWDDLYEVVAKWGQLNAEQKRRWLRFARMAKLLREVSGEGRLWG